MYKLEKSQHPFFIHLNFPLANSSESQKNLCYDITKDAQAYASVITAICSTALENRKNIRIIWKIYVNRGSSVSIVTMLGEIHPKNYNTFFNRGKSLISCPKSPEGIWRPFCLLNNEMTELVFLSLKRLDP